MQRHCKKHLIQHIHCHSCADAAHLVALCRLLGGPTYSLTLHGDLEVYGEHHNAKVKHAKFVTAVTKPLKAQLSELPNLDKADIPIIWMGVDTEQFRPIDHKEKNRNLLKILTVARLNRNKGHRYLLRAIKSVTEAGYAIEYTIAGSGPAESEILEEIRRLKLTDRVNLVGSISENQIIAQLQNTDVFVLPSVGHGEAAPVSVMEAMACGLPVISSIIGGTPDLIENQRDGFLVEQKDIDKLSVILQELCINHNLRQNVGKAARTRAVSEFDSLIGAKKLLNLINSSGESDVR